MSFIVSIPSNHLIVPQFQNHRNRAKKEGKTLRKLTSDHIPPELSLESLEQRMPFFTVPACEWKVTIESDTSESETLDEEDIVCNPSSILEHGLTVWLRKSAPGMPALVMIWLLPLLLMLSLRLIRPPVYMFLFHANLKRPRFPRPYGLAHPLLRSKLDPWTTSMTSL